MAELHFSLYGLAAERVRPGSPVRLRSVLTFVAHAAYDFVGGPEDRVCPRAGGANNVPGKELPRKPWLLRYKVAEHEYVSPMQYMTSVGYFEPKGFQSLRHEQFQSSAAPRTPILYCKMLLEAENGKGTNVLFGDGHIEWVTAAELDRLKARPRP